jgi:hypothetical protein
MPPRHLPQVDAALVGRRVELLFDPFDLTTIEVRWHGRPMGAAVPYTIGRHMHHKARPDTDPAPPPSTGIDYLRLVEQHHTGFTRMPFGRALAPGMLHRHTSYAEAVARIDWCVTERALGVITGEVSAGKTVAIRAALARLDTSRHTII